jgi:pimeloyl-ACP methyl ester carboxylesterase
MIKADRKLSTENYLTLPDGRKLCYAEYGDPNGTPIFVFHGGSNSRLLWDVIPGCPFLSDVWLIAPDRPGFGRTDYIEGLTTVENWPNDIAALADHLGIEKFAVFGPSGGGPSALACAWKIPERLTAVGVFASVGPFNEETKEGLKSIIIALWDKAPKMPRLFKLQMRLYGWIVRNKPEWYIKMIKSEFSDKDQEVYERLKIAEVNMPDRLEAYHQNGIGIWYDVMIPASWPIPLNEIKAKVFLWQGAKDESVSPAMGRYIAKHIPDCEAEYIEDEGHFWIFEHCTEMLEKLVNYTKEN